MNAYERCGEIEQIARRELIKRFKKYTILAHNYPTFELQVSRGDGIIRNPGVIYRRFDSKGEWVSTPNCFVETDSNRHTNRPGWLINLEYCDVIAYWVNEIRKMRYIHLPSLRKLDLTPFRETMPRIEQPNATWGRLVPWVVLQEAGILITEEQWLGNAQPLTQAEWLSAHALSLAVARP